MADGDMLIYEPQGFSLTILRFTETERGGEKLRQAQGAKPGGEGGDGSGVAGSRGSTEGKIKFKQVMPLIGLIVFH